MGCFTHSALNQSDCMFATFFHMKIVSHALPKPRHHSMLSLDESILKYDDSLPPSVIFTQRLCCRSPFLPPLSAPSKMQACSNNGCSERQVLLKIKFCILPFPLNTSLPKQCVIKGFMFLVPSSPSSSAWSSLSAVAVALVIFVLMSFRFRHDVF